MSGVGDKLQSYLSSGKAHDGDGSDHIGLIDGIRSSKLSSWFSQRRDQPVDDTANGWFSQAQQDPCFPSLVKDACLIANIYDSILVEKTTCVGVCWLSSHGDVLFFIGKLSVFLYINTNNGLFRQVCIFQCLY